MRTDRFDHLASGAYLLTRPKRGIASCLIDHYGVLFHNLPGIPTCVFELATQGPRLLHLLDFARGDDVRILDSKSAQEAGDVVQRANDLLSKAVSYRPFQRNCEHASRWVFYKQFVSHQVERAIDAGIKVLQTFAELAHQVAAAHLQAEVRARARVQSRQQSRAPSAPRSGRKRRRKKQ